LTRRLGLLGTILPQEASISERGSKESSMNHTQLTTVEIFTRLTDLRKTVETTIYGGKGWSDYWVVKFEFKSDKEDKIEVTSRKELFHEAVQDAWERFEKLICYGAGVHNLLPPVEHKEIEDQSEEVV
jgi:hypothetical protein